MADDKKKPTELEAGAIHGAIMAIEEGFEALNYPPTIRLSVAVSLLMGQIILCRRRTKDAPSVLEALAQGAGMIELARTCPLEDYEAIVSASDHAFVRERRPQVNEPMGVSSDGRHTPGPIDAARSFTVAIDSEVEDATAALLLYVCKRAGFDRLEVTSAAMQELLVGLGLRMEKAPAGGYLLQIVPQAALAAEYEAMVGGAPIGRA